MVSDGSSSCSRLGPEDSSQHVSLAAPDPLASDPAAIAFTHSVSSFSRSLEPRVPPQLPLPELDSSAGVHVRATGAAVDGNLAVAGEQPRPACSLWQLWWTLWSPFPQPGPVLQVRTVFAVTTEPEICSQGHCSASCLSLCE